jgi:L-lactate dehydrogenase
MAVCRIVRAIFNNENSVFTASVRLRGEYGLRNEVFIGNPCIINSGGANRILELSLTDEELEKFRNSYTILDESFKSINI